MGDQRTRVVAVLVVAALLIWAAPLLGLLAAGPPLAGHLAFPPRTVPVSHAPFSWGVFLVLALAPLGTLALYAVALARARPSPASKPPLRFPWWGWAGLLLLAVGWGLAWSGSMLPPEWRRHAFTPLWLGYILVMNALAWQRSGASPLTHRRAWFASLFLASAVFWWLFEHLNRFVGNWHYTGIGKAGDFAYFLQGSLPFSTVLPAVASTTAWLGTFPRLNTPALPPLRGSSWLAWESVLTGAAGLVGIGLAPQWLYAMLWIAPLLLIAGLAHLVVGVSALSPLAHGDWRPLLLPALAALVCGFFWELWNWGSSLARWQYSVPYVQRFHLFEMPLLGYAGYLPFGVICALVMDLLARLVSGARA